MFVCELFTDHRDKCSMVQMADNISLLARVLVALVERHSDTDRSPVPPIILINPHIRRLFVVIKSISGQLCIDSAPFSISHIFWPEMLTADNIKEVVKALVRLLDTVAPVPFT